MGLATRLRLGWGKVRRAYLHMFNREYVRRNHARRNGECARCGACCELMFRCPYLEGPDGDTSCVRHGTRWENCRIFPVDERDLADRDLVSRNGECGYSFDPPMKPQRWIVLALAALAGLAGSARAGEAEKPGRETPLVLGASFASGRAPEGWRIESGTWEPARKGIRSASEGASLAASLREDMTPVSGMDFRVEVWATLKAGREIRIRRPGPAFDVGVRWGGLEAGIFESGETGRAEAVFPGELRCSEPDISIPAGRFRLEFAFERGLVSVSVGRERALAARDVFGALAGNAPRDVIVTATPGTVIHAVRVSATPAPRRAEALDRGDRARQEGDPQRAAVSYSEALADDTLAAAVRAEAAYKLGLHLEAGESFVDAARSLDRAQKLDPWGPWGERARVALGRAALAAGDAKTALAFADLAASNAAPEIEDWAGYRALVSDSWKNLLAAGDGFRATYALRGIAERIEWTRSARARAAWTWGEVARSLDDRGRVAEAEAVRKRAMSVLGRRAKVAADGAGPPRGSVDEPVGAPVAGSAGAPVGTPAAASVSGDGTE